MELLYLLGIVMWLAVAWKWGDRKHIKHYNASMALQIIGNLVYGVLSSKYSLWEYESPNLGLNHTVIDLVLTFITFPCSILVYLTHFPKGKWKPVFYICGWVLLYSSHEWILRISGLFTYHHGWNLWWSIFLDFLAFCILRLNQSNPYLAYFMFICFTIMFIYIFRMPVMELK